MALKIYTFFFFAHSCGVVVMRLKRTYKLRSYESNTRVVVFKFDTVEK